MTNPQSPEPKYSPDEVDLCKGCNTMKHLAANGLCGRCQPKPSDELEMHDKLVDLRHKRDMHLMDEDEYTAAVLALIAAERLRAVEEFAGSLNVLQDCHEDCTESEHAYHQGTWDSQEIINDALTQWRKQQ